MTRYYGSPAPQEVNRWVRQGAIFTAPSWASPGVLEPTVIYVGAGDWRMWFRGGGLHQEGTNGGTIGYATSTDGLAWTDSGAKILGRGTGGESATVICPSTVFIGSTYYIYYSDITNNKVKVASSANGHSGFTVADTGLALPTGGVVFGNNTVWKESSTYYMLIEAYISAAAAWRIYYATSSSPTSGFTYGNGGAALSTLNVGSPAGAGGPHVLSGSPTISGLYQCWFQGDNDGSGSDIYRAYSSDRINWTQVGIVLDHTGTDYEINQIADPCVLEVSSTSYMYYDADESAGGICAIKLATYAGTLAQLIA